MQRPNLTIIIPEITIGPPTSRPRGSGAFSARPERRSFFSRWRLGGLRSPFSFSRSRQEPPGGDPRASHSHGVLWDELAGYMFTVPASAEAIMGLRAPAAGERRELACAVCLEDFEAADDDLSLRRMPCSHSFHERCISRWLRISRACPCCRHPLRDKTVHDELDELEAAGALDAGSGDES